MKIITVLLTIMALLLCTACSHSKTHENIADSTMTDTRIVQVDWKHNKVYQWQDYFEAEKYPFGEDFELKLKLADFPDTVFIWRDYGIYSYINEEEYPLASGLPLWNAFFTDLNADGFPELCTTVSWGSGFIDDHIIVYDYHNKKEYVLWDRFQSDYSLYLENDMLYVRELPYLRDENAKANIGQLAIENSELVMKQ